MKGSSKRDHLKRMRWSESSLASPFCGYVSTVERREFLLFILKHFVQVWARKFERKHFLSSIRSKERSNSLDNNYNNKSSGRGRRECFRHSSCLSKHIWSLYLIMFEQREHKWKRKRERERSEWARELTASNQMFRWCNYHKVQIIRSIISRSLLHKRNCNCVVVESFYQTWLT